jgi:ubiquitin-like protein ATG12
MSSNNTPPPKQQASDDPISSSPRIRQAAFMSPRSPSSMASPQLPQSPSSSAVADAIPESQDEAADLPLTMTASVILTSLPGDAKKALEKAASGGDAPVKGMYHPHIVCIREPYSYEEIQYTN